MYESESRYLSDYWYTILRKELETRYAVAWEIIPGIDADVPSTLLVTFSEGSDLELELLDLPGRNWLAKFKRSFRAIQRRLLWAWVREENWPRLETLREVLAQGGDNCPLQSILASIGPEFWDHPAEVYPFAEYVAYGR